MQYAYANNSVAGNFKCACCQYETIIYTDQEWFFKKWHIGLGEFIGYDIDQVEDAYIFRDDIDEDFPVHKALSRLCKEVQYNEEGIAPERIQWTSLLVKCPTCNKNTMFFTSFYENKNMLAMFKIYINLKKLPMTFMPYIDRDGDRVICLDGTGSVFSAS